MIDWELADRVGQAIAGGEGANGATPLPGELEPMADSAREGVVAYARMQPTEELPPPEAIGRGVWLQANLRTMRGTIDPLVDRVAGGPGPLAGPMRAAGGALLAAEIGGVVGYMSRHVLGQYELSLFDAAQPPRLFVVAPNLREAAANMEVRLEDLLPWVVFHEVTHAVQFSSVPWLRDHVAGLLRELLSTVDVKVDASVLLRLPNADDLRGLWDQVRDEGLITAVAGPERKALIDRLQATMAMVEGHAEHVMDAAGAPVLPNVAELRTALNRRRRDRPPVFKLLERLLGLELKLRQYEDGRRFCDGVVQRGGIDALNRAWTAPERLPTLAELDDPAAWIRRTEIRVVTPPA
jgi:coenzyme F420 biosynthesis associated uncharacterized protein